MRQPHGSVSGVSLSAYRPGEVYDIPAMLAEYLVVEELAILEMRDSNREREPIEIAVERRRRRSGGATPGSPSFLRRFP